MIYSHFDLRESVHKFGLAHVIFAMYTITLFSMLILVSYDSFSDNFCHCCTRENDSFTTSLRKQKTNREYCGGKIAIVECSSECF